MATPTPKQGVVCVGSLNVDIFAYMERFPNPGETLSGTRSTTCCGGKGSNQAVMAARLGAQTAMVGKVGGDAFGSSLREAMVAEGLDTSHLLETTDGTATGTAQIWVNSQGMNMIVILAGANGELRPADVLTAEATLFATAAVVMVQLEVPQETTLEALRLAKAQQGVVSILNPAPAPKDGLPKEFLELASIVCPNETELEILTGLPVQTLDEIRVAAMRLQAMGANTVLVTLGARGALLLDKAESAKGGVLLACPPAEAVVDTSGAGDCFLGSLAAYLAHGVALPEAVGRACRVATLSVGKPGTQPSYPHAKELPDDLRLPGDVVK